MVAYSFKARFAPAIIAGWKTQTIRGHRDRHARPGERVSLYTGMRTKHCRKIAEVLCTEVMRVVIEFDAEGGIAGITTDGVPVRDLDAFAVRDGFEDLGDMQLFWWPQYGQGRNFHGVIIEWAAPRDGMLASDGASPLKPEFA